MNRILASLLVVSLLANGGLVAVWLRQAPVAPPVAPPVPTVPATAPPPPPPVWALAPGEDARGYATRLRATGMPAATARLLVADALRRQYLERQREVIGTTEPAEFWKSVANAADRDRQATLRRLAREQEDLLTELFGPDEAALAERARERMLYGPLPDEKLARIDRIHTDYGDMADDLRARAGGLLLATDREMLALLEQERRKDVAAILTAAELEDYDLQTSPTARTLRARLAGFAPTEREFRALYGLQRDFDQRFNGGSDENRRRERTAAEAELTAKIRDALGAQRFAEFQRSQDSGYRVAVRIAERFGLPARRANEVHDLASATQARLAALRDQKAPLAGSMQQALAGLARETGERLKSLLGSEGAELYRQTSTGAWLRALERGASESSEVAATVDRTACPGSSASEGAAPNLPAPGSVPAAAAAPSGPVAPGVVPGPSS